MLSKCTLLLAAIASLSSLTIGAQEVGGESRILQSPVDPLVAAQAGRMTLQSETCVVSLPQATEPPSKKEVADGWAWVGSPKLAAHVPANGVWTGMGPEHNYRNKWWWWREGYRAIEEPQPELMIMATRLDAPAEPVVILKATNAFGDTWDRMLVGMEFPTAGCWDVFASYRGEELRFIFKVGS